MEGILLQGHVKLARFVTMRRGVEDETGVQLDILWKVKVHQLVQFSTLVRCLSKGDSVWLLAIAFVLHTPFKLNLPNINFVPNK